MENVGVTVEEIRERLRDPDEVDRMAKELTGNLVAHEFLDRLTIDGEPHLRLGRNGRRYLDRRRRS